MKFGRRIRREAYLVAAFLLLTAFFNVAFAADAPTAAYYRQVEIQQGTVTGEVKVNVRKRADADADRLGRLAPGESCTVTGEEGDWWQVEFEGETGYVLKELLTVTVSLDEVAVIVEDPLEADLTGLTLPTVLRYRNDYALTGTISANIPLTGVVVEVYNRRTFATDATVTKTFDHDDGVREFDLSKMDMSFRKMEPGEKTLIIRAKSANDSVIVAEAPFYVYADGRDGYASLANITLECNMEATHGKARSLIDNDYETTLAFDKETDALSIEIPEGRTAGALTLEWETAPERVRVTMLSADGAEIGVIDEENPDGMIGLYYELDEATREVIVSTTDAGKALCEARVYEKDRVPEMVQQWEQLPEKLDMLVISTHQDDEMLFFGGTIPYYAMQGKKVGVVYMANCSRERYAEAMDGLWSCGLKYHPIFVGFRDVKLDSYNDTVDIWGMDNTVNTLVDLIRKYRPEVIVTHDINGEYGHNQHKVTCAAVRSAVSQAGDPAISPDSASTYGTWTPKKLYIHLFDQNEIYMSVYDEPVEELGGMSMTQIATIGYSKHVSQQNYFSMEEHGVKYDNRKYGLAFTTVGEDVEKNDFFENVD